MASDTSDNALLSHVLVPVANPDDARKTAVALKDACEPDRVTLLHVVEKAHGVPDTLSVEQAEALATASFEAFEEEWPEADTHITYRRNVVAAIFDVAQDIEANAVAFHSRNSGRLARLLTGNRTRKLAMNPDVPVISLPDPDSE